MWITQETKNLGIRNKRRFEEKNGECAAWLQFSVLIFVSVYRNIKLIGAVRLKWTALEFTKKETCHSIVNAVKWQVR
jgi:hypothetical protein